MRRPTVAGKFYPASPKKLKNDVSKLVNITSEKQTALGILSPHAGYMYSGAIAGAVFSIIELPKTFVIIGPNHTGLGECVSISSCEEWEMPGGNVKINSKLTEIIKSKTKLIKEDNESHKFEHSLEVQIPFIQNFLDEFDIVPICLRRVEYSKCEEIGLAIANSIKEYDQPVLIISSSDMTHYEPKEIAESKDRMALDEITRLNPKGLFTVVQEHSISMCGFVPVTIMLIASLEQGASRAKTIKYITSGDVSGDYERVVGYAGVIVA